MKKFNYLGLLSLLALIGILGFITPNKGFIGFLGFGYYVRYFLVIPDECFRQMVQKAATLAFMSEMLVLLPLMYLLVFLSNSTDAPKLAFAVVMVVSYFTFTFSLVFFEWKEQQEASRE